MADRILTQTVNTVIDTTAGSNFPTAYLLNMNGSSSVSSGVLAVNMTSLKSPDTSTSRGFYFGLGMGHDLKYSFDYRFEPATAGETAVLQVYWEGCDRNALTFDTTWKTESRYVVRPIGSQYSGFVFYKLGSKTFPLGTYYIRNLKFERTPWVFTIGGKPLKITV